MVLFTLFFTLGIWLLQQQAVLPDFSWAWLLSGISLHYPLSRWRERARVRGTKNGNPIEYRLAIFIRIALVAAFACGLGFYHAAWQAEQRLAVSLQDEWQGRDIEVIGVVSGLPRPGERGLRFSFDVEKTLTPDVQARPLSPTLSRVAGEGAHESLREIPLNVNVPEHIYLSTYFNPRSKPLELHAGERWRLTLRLKQPHGSSNPHGFDFELWALENNVRAVGYVHNAEKLMAGHTQGNNVRLDALADGVFYRIESWREAVRDKFNATLGNAPYAGVLSALAIGDQSSIPQAQWQIFTRTGINHLVSISGLHITMLSGMSFALCYGLWRRSARLTLWLPARKAAAIAALLVATGYALLSGFGIPAQRTVYMVAAVAAALWLNRNFSLAQILSIALLAVLLADPWAVLSPGFWLSFGAVALILYSTAHRIGRAFWLPEEGSGFRHALNDPFIQEQTPQHFLLRGKSLAFLRVLREYATVQWAMSIGLIPLLLGLFQQVSLVSPIANAFAIPLVSLIVVPLALLGAALPTDVPLWLAHIALDWTMIPLQWLNDLPRAVWTQHAPPAWSIVFGMLGVIWILLPSGFPARWLGLLLMLPMFLNAPEAPQPGTVRLIVFDVGQGLSVAAQTRHHALLYDTGPDFSGEADSGNRILIPGLRAMGISTLDGVILSHDDIDHTGGTASILQAMPVNWVSFSQPITQLKSVSVIPVETRRCREGDRWNWDGVQFEILHPGQNNRAKPHDNEQSCVLRISAGNQHILLTGDIGKHSEQRLLRDHADQLAASLLVAPHHGSASSSNIAFVAAVLPDYAVFTAGYRNRFGHPKPEVLQRYADSGAQLLRSDRDGAILVEMNARELTVERYRKTHHRYWTHRPKTD
ncbi:MAG: DNA internalization-related competence protein ComEC/Rec2 [Gallionella sp.]|nr:DNA internalization-related competence protein ComEC/Rec2 [Gallionella sp.]